MHAFEQSAVILAGGIASGCLVAFAALPQNVGKHGYRAEREDRSLLLVGPPGRACTVAIEARRRMAHG